MSNYRPVGGAYAPPRVGEGLTPPRPVRTLWAVLTDVRVAQWGSGLPPLPPTPIPAKDSPTTHKKEMSKLQ